MKLDLLPESERNAIIKLTEAITALPPDLWFSIEEDEDGSENVYCLVVWKKDKVRPGVSVEVARLKLDE